MQRELRINNSIRAREVRVIDPDGKQMGIYPLKEAVNIAENYKLDLVEVGPKEIPPVCKIIDYGKYRYMLKKRAQESKKRQATIQIKEIKMRPKTEEHDLLVKARHIKRFLEKGNRVKLTVRFRGREMAYRSMGEDTLKKIVSYVSEQGAPADEPRMEGRNMTMTLVSTIHGKGKGKVKRDAKVKDQERGI